MMRALFDDQKILGPAEPFPDFSELGGKQFTKEGSNTDVGKIIAASSNRRAVAGAWGGKPADRRDPDTDRGDRRADQPAGAQRSNRGRQSR